MSSFKESGLKTEVQKSLLQQSPDACIAFLVNIKQSPNENKMNADCDCAINNMHTVYFIDQSNNH